jgi:choline dehydrogenase
VILAGGTINSPQLLELSGIGQGERLRALGIDVIADLPGVGENLQDHFVVGERFRLKANVMSVNEMARGVRFLGEAAKYLFQKRGLLTLSAAHIAVFCRSRPELAGPDIQFHILPATMDIDKLANEQKMELEKQPGLTIAPCQLGAPAQRQPGGSSGDPDQLSERRGGPARDRLGASVGPADRRPAGARPLYRS